MPTENRYIYVCDGSEFSINEGNTQPIGDCFKWDTTQKYFDSTQITFDNSCTIN